MIISVISDTHRHKESMIKSLEYVKNSQVLIHLGDNVEDVQFYKEHFNGSIFNVKGNCDVGGDAETEQIVKIHDKKILIMHGHTYNVKYGLVNLKYKAMEEKVDAVLYGHTHVASTIFEEGIWFINPGSLSRPRYGKGSFALLEIKDFGIIPSINEL